MNIKKTDFGGYFVAIDEVGNRKVQANDNSFHLYFRRADGYTAKWGKTFDEDPTHCPWGNEIADIEVTTSCRGIRDENGNRRVCPWCYKANTPNGKYMTLETFKIVFDKLNKAKTMTQIALGVDAECKTNPDIWKIMDYCLENEVVPNVTIADINEETAKNIVQRCGACAVSCYPINKNRCYDSIRMLIDEAKRQGKVNFKVNMHLLISRETQDFVMEVLEDRLNDNRINNGMGAIVMLSLKQKGRGTAYHKMDLDVYKKVVAFFEDHGISYGSDSCGANKLVDALKEYHSVENWEKRITNIISSGKMCKVATLGKKEFVDWVDSGNGVEIYREHKKILKAIGNAISYTSTFPLSETQVILPRNFANDNACFVGVEVRMFTNENGTEVPRYCHYKCAFEKSEMVDVSLLKTRINEVAKVESESRIGASMQSVENCESTKFSIFVNVKGEVFPCSFMEKEPGWEKGIDLTDDQYKDYTTQVWNHPRIVEWRQMSMKCVDCNGRCVCPHYEI